MICQSCNIHPANIRLRQQTNYETSDLFLCKDCFEKFESSNQSIFGSFGTNGSVPISQLFDSFFDLDNSMNSHQNSQTNTKSKTQTKTQKRKTFLDQYARNLNDLVEQGKVTQIIGREKEINNVIETLNLKEKNNPVLIGEPGVGKTAVVEGLAYKIVHQQVPRRLFNKQVYELSLTSMVSGTSLRGQFEERMQKLIAELETRDDIILFIDEIHSLVGAGDAEGAMDAGNILKPALARGDFQVIGATTLKEYRKVEKDSALERRFQPIIVKEPTREDTLAILEGISKRYEAFHSVIYPQEVLEACVDLSIRYIQDRFLPDKAIDLMDRAGSRMNLRNENDSIISLEEKLDIIRKQKEDATEKENYEKAAELRNKEVEAMQEIEKFQLKNKPALTVEDIQTIVEDKTGIPVTKLQASEQQKLQNLQAQLSSRVIGQDRAVIKVSKAIRRSRAGLKDKNRPIASFLFVGPTGVGKTELTKVLAEELFGTKDSMIRLDMSEYMEKHSVSKLIGSPPGYVGHDEAGQLTERVRRNPYSIILLDEIEKAHPDVQNIFLQIIEDGRLTDSQGRTVNFKDTIIIATSNAGISEKIRSLGFNENVTEHSIVESLKSSFRPEFLNRFDGIVEFSQLEKTSLLQIVNLMLKTTLENMKEQNITVEISDAAKEKLTEIGYDRSFGARPLRRAIQEHIEDSIADVVLDNENVSTILISLVDNKIIAQSK